MGILICIHDFIINIFLRKQEVFPNNYHNLYSYSYIDVTDVTCFFSGGYFDRFS